jgi:ribonuclease HI
LGAKVLRAKYYPDGCLLKATLKSGSSFTWQSILAGLECFKKGCIWRVGDGSQINIWEDNWIPSSHNLKIMTPRGTNILTSVADLINPIDGLWDEDIIQDIFWPVDAHRILQIPLTPNREDLVAWHHSKIGLFSVRSAYYCQWDHKFGRHNRNTNIAEGANNEVWKSLWNLEIPNKIKIFGWRVLHAMIPCRGVLANRHIGNTGGCPICLSDCEDIKHLLFSCARAKQIWSDLGLSELIESVMEVDRSGSVVIEEIIRRGDRVEAIGNIGLAEIVLIAGWYIWWERRQLVHGEKVQTTFRSAMSIRVLAMNYMKVLKKQDKKPEDRWKKPLEGLVMINIDAAFELDSGRGATGVVIRDYTGSCIAALQTFLPHVVDAQMAEAYALRDGLMLAQQIGVQNFVVQSDCVQVVETMRNGGFSATSSAAIYDDCSILWSGFGNVSIEHCNRGANQVAHELARVAFSSGNSCTWVDEPPRFILSKLVDDVTIL